DGLLPAVDVRATTMIRQLIPAARVRYLSEIAETVRAYQVSTEVLAEQARRVQRLESVSAELASIGRPAESVTALLMAARSELSASVRQQIEAWPAVVESYQGVEHTFRVRDQELRTRLTRESLSGNQIPRVVLPRFVDHGELVRSWRREN